MIPQLFFRSKREQARGHADAIPSASAPITKRKAAKALIRRRRVSGVLEAPRSAPPKSPSASTVSPRRSPSSQRCAACRLAQAVVEGLLPPATPSAADDARHPLPLRIGEPGELASHPTLALSAARMGLLDRFRRKKKGIALSDDEKGYLYEQDPQRERRQRPGPRKEVSGSMQRYISNWAPPPNLIRALRFILYVGRDSCRDVELTFPSSSDPAIQLRSHLRLCAHDRCAVSLCRRLLQHARPGDQARMGLAHRRHRLWPRHPLHPLRHHARHAAAIPPR